jgi:hypothetical protein
MKMKYFLLRKNTEGILNLFKKNFIEHNPSKVSNALF